MSDPEGKSLEDDHHPAPNHGKCEARTVECQSVQPKAEVETIDPSRTEPPLASLSLDDSTDSSPPRPKKEKKPKLPPNFDREDALLERIRRAWEDDEVGLWIGMDLEAYEFDHDRITEVGFCRRAASGEQRSEHFIVKENKRVRNKRYVPDARDNFAYGDSETLPQLDINARLTALLPTENERPLVLVFHAPGLDLESLELLGIATGSFLAFPTDSEPLERGEVYVVDTQVVFCAISRVKQKSSLANACLRLSLGPAEHLNPRRYAPALWHNAGNDAHFTLQLLEHLTERDLVAKSAEQVEQEETKKREARAKQWEKEQQESLEWSTDEKGDKSITGIGGW